MSPELSRGSILSMLSLKKDAHKSADLKRVDFEPYFHAKKQNKMIAKKDKLLYVELKLSLEKNVIVRSWRN